MRSRAQPLWLRKSAAQVVYQWTARRHPSKWVETAEARDGLVKRLCLELVIALAERIPDARVARELRDVWARAYDQPASAEQDDA